MYLGENLSSYTALVQKGFTYWRDKCGDRPLPRWRDINPAEIKSLLPSVVIVHVLQDPLDFIEKITGETILQNSALNSMGKNWLAYPGRGPDSQIWKVFSEVAETRKPNFQVIPYVGPNKDFMKVETVICPISDDGSTVNKIMAFVDYCLPAAEAVEQERGRDRDYKLYTE